MGYPVLAGIVTLLAVAAGFIAIRMLLRGSWLLAWLRGMTGLLLLVIAGVMVLIAIDLNSYRQLQQEQTIATLSFSRDDEQFYTVTLVNGEGAEQQFELMGDLWQLDARLLQWHPNLLRLGFRTGYKLDRISGRYLSLQDEQLRPRTVYELASSESALDTWQWLHDYGKRLQLIDAQYGSATYLPMADGALFSVSLGSGGLVARPLNEPAKAVVTGWQ